MTLDRRNVLRTGVATVAGLAAVNLGRGASAAATETAEPQSDEFDFVVVGSGPGGAPLAANLAELGFEVLVLEAGPSEGNKDFYDVPAFSNYAAAADEMIRWDYYVQHYSDIAFNKTDTKWVHGRGGILYPRASTLGGCTAHHAMITMYPEHSDWAYIQRLTGDDSWAPEAMWRHWEQGVLSWLTVEIPPLEAVAAFDLQIGAIVEAAKAEARRLPGGDVIDNPRGVNDRKNVDISAQGFFYAPQATRKGRRVGPRERLRAIQNNPTYRLTVVTDALVERLVLERTSAGRQHAVAVDYLAGSHLYGASPRFRPTSAAERAALRRTVRVRREVIVAGGVYGSPQLLMLSGIGPKDHLTKVGIPVKIDLPGVGTNLQDRYEVPVVTDHPRFLATSVCTFNKGLVDPCLAAWKGLEALNVDALGYGANGVVAGIRRRFGADRRNQLYVFGSPADFRGYVPGFDSGYIHERFTWLILKAYAESRAGTVRLRSADPTRPPLINIRNFNDGAGGRRDIAAILEAIAMVRRINKRAGKGTEVWPGPAITDDDLEPWIRREAWGHHASCTNPIGPASDPMAVLDGKFRVHGTDNIRVVDASAFPRIPGLFIWAPTAMLAEKASADIIAAAEVDASR